MTAVTTQSNKIVLNEVKDNKALLEPSYGKKKKTSKLLGQPKTKKVFRHFLLVLCTSLSLVS